MNEGTRCEREDEPAFFFLPVCVVNVSENTFSQHTSPEMMQLFSWKNVPFTEYVALQHNG